MTPRGIGLKETPFCRNNKAAVDSGHWRGTGTQYIVRVERGEEGGRDLEWMGYSEGWICHWTENTSVQYWQYSTRARLYWIGTEYPYLKSKWEKSVRGRNWLQLCPPAMPLGNTHWAKCNVCVRRFNLYCSLAIVIRCIIALKSNLPFESAA